MCVTMFPGPLHGVAFNCAQEELVLLGTKLRVVSGCSFKTDASSIFGNPITMHECFVP